MRNKQEKLVLMEDVIGDLAVDYGIPLMTFENFVTLAKRAVQVYGLEGKAKKILFQEICEYVLKFLATPFGRKMVLELTEDLR